MSETKMPLMTSNQILSVLLPTYTDYYLFPLATCTLVEQYPSSMFEILLYNVAEMA